MLKIYVASHVERQAPRLPYLGFVRTGAAMAADPCGAGLRDDRGDHISPKNGNYCELTVLYWLWKNTSDTHVGLCHYRRFFSPILMPPENRSGAAVSAELAQCLLAHDEHGVIFRTEADLCDMIVPARDARPRSAAQMYAEHCRVSDWDAMIRSIAELLPHEHEPAKKFFDGVHPLHYYNMFIARKPVADAYCAWLFPLLSHVEAAIVPSDDPYQARVFGFLAERLFNWWTASRGLRLVERPILQVAG